MNRLNGLTIAAAAVLVAGCEQTPSQPAQHISAGTFSNFDAISGSAQCIAPPASAAGFASYKPFVVPAGYSQRIVASQLDDFGPAAGASGDVPDMNTLNETGRFAGRFIYRTHEVGSNGAVTVTDLWTGETSLISQSLDYNRLDGIAWSPWGTLVFAEETGGGLVFEFDPATGVVTPRPAVGARSHEGLRFDPQGNFYGISESNPGPIFKFVPDRRGDLSSGQLYALKVDDAVSLTGHAVWVPLDRALSQTNSNAAAAAAGASGWNRPEDVEIGTSTGNNAGGNQVLYVAVTGTNLVLKIDLSGDEAFVTNYVHDVAGFTLPDNLALNIQGDLYITEDPGTAPTTGQGDDIWVARAGEGGAIERFASLSDCAAEPTGIYFDRGAHVLYVNVQHAGGPLSNDLLVAIAPSN